MTAQQLKNSILKLAISGKLVPQDPNDEPASVLIEKIRKEKDKLIKEGKIKKEKNPSYIFRGSDNMPYEKVGDNEPVCIADEVPFEIPDGWEWRRLKNICNIINGFTPLRTNLDFWNNGTIPWFTVEDIHTQGHRIKKTNQKINQIALTKNKNRVLPKNTVLICCTASVGEYAITETEMTTNQQFNGLVIKDECKKYYSPEFLFLLVQTFKERLINTAGKTTFNFISVQKLGEFLVPILPLNEQLRIVEKYNAFPNYIKQYSKLQTELDTLDKEFPEKLKKSILQEAIKGKLVEQDKSDEPASVLLDNIRKEKEKLIKEGKIKKDKNESIIYKRDNSYYEKLNGVEKCIDDEIPFEIPENWEWCYIPDVCYFQEGPGILATDFKTKGIPLIRISGMQNNYVKLTGCNYLDPNVVMKKYDHFRLDKGDIVISTSASLDKIAEVGDEAIGAIPYTGLIRFKMYLNFSKEYFINYIKSPIYFKQITSFMSGVAIKHYGPTHLKKVLVPIPPIKEQKRITEKIKNLFKILNVK